MKLSELLSATDNHHRNGEGYGIDFFADDNFRYIQNPGIVNTKHLVISQRGDVYLNTRNYPFDKSNTLLSCPDTITEQQLYYISGLLAGSTRAMVKQGLLGILYRDFPEFGDNPSSIQMRIKYASKELQKLINEAHNLRVDFYKLYKSFPATATLSRYTHLSNIKLSEAVVQKESGDDVHFAQSGLIEARDARDNTLLEGIRARDVEEKLYLTLLSSITKSCYPTTPVHDRAVITDIITKLSGRHLIRNLSLQRQVERYLKKQLADLVVQLNNE